MMALKAPYAGYSQSTNI